MIHSQENENKRRWPHPVVRKSCTFEADAALFMSNSVFPPPCGWVSFKKENVVPVTHVLGNDPACETVERWIDVLCTELHGYF